MQPITINKPLRIILRNPDRAIPKTIRCAPNQTPDESWFELKRGEHPGEPVRVLGLSERARDAGWTLDRVED